MLGAVFAKLFTKLFEMQRLPQRMNRCLMFPLSTRSWVKGLMSDVVIIYLVLGQWVDV